MEFLWHSSADFHPIMQNAENFNDAVRRDAIIEDVSAIARLRRKKANVE